MQTSFYFLICVAHGMHGLHKLRDFFLFELFSHLI